jgi:hypothetical protein
MLKNSKIGIFLMIVFFLSACNSNLEENNAYVSISEKVNDVHFNTRVTAVRNGTVIERAIKSVSIYTGTLSVKDLNTKQIKTYDWFANLNTDTFDLNSTTTITLAPSTYELTLLLTKGKIQYVGRKTQNIKDKDSLNIDFALSPVVGDVIIDVKSIDRLMNFELKYDINDFYSLNTPNMSLGVGNDDMVNFKINPSSGFDKLFMNIPEGERTINLKLFDGNKQVAKATEDVLVEHGTDISIDIKPLKGDLSFNLNANDDFDINLTIPNELFESTGSIANTKSVIKILSSAKGKLETKEFNIVKNNGIYQASLSFKSLELNSSVSIEIAFFNKEQNNKLAGKMTLVVPSVDQHKKVSASFGVYSKAAGLGGNVLASVSMNIHNKNDEVLSGVRVYLDNELLVIVAITVIYLHS